MKVYVVKSKQTKEYQTVVMDFIPDIRQSDIFIDYEVALAYCPSDCEVVECELMEKTELADYTKQVRKEVLSELRNMLGDRAELIDFGNGCAEFMFTTYDLQECSKEILDQIEQGETKGE